MSNFKAKMHQIRFPLGAPPQIPLGELTVLPRPLYLRGLLLRGGRGRGDGKGRGRKREGRRRRREGNRTSGTTQNLVATPLQ